jgi:intracellular multiplication protein IcmT
MRNPHTAHWRDSSRTPKFFVLDAFSAIPLLLMLLHIRWWTFFTAVGVCVFFMVLNRFGFTLPIFLRWLRAFIAGNQRVAHFYKDHKEHD